jgi:protein involved in polysaccharide export with SLBB domain
MTKDSLKAFRTAAAASLLVLALSGATVRAQVTGPGTVGADEPRAAEPRASLLELRGPVDDREYVVGPGDRLSITIWGQSVTTLSEMVTPEGDLILPGVAAVHVAGRTLREVKDDVRSRLRALYRNSEVSIALTSLRRIQVNVLGEVEAPGAYTVTALSPASELVGMAGGLMDGASRRNIVISRRGGARARLDLTRYENTGDLSADPPILDGDIVFVPHAVEFVGIYGGVARPGEYELTDGETIASLIEVAGGLARGAVSDTVEVSTNVGRTTRRSLLVDISSPEGSGRVLRDGDQIVVRYDPEWHSLARVVVEGAVAFPGEYAITEGVDRLSDVVRRAGGPTADASLAAAELTRTSVRRNRDLEYERLKDVGISDMSSSEYAYFKSRERNPPGRVSADFERALEGDESQDVLVFDGDRVVIPKEDPTVEVIGQVARPGRVSYKPGERYGYYVGEAGGYASGAQRSGTRVIVGATGERRRAVRAGPLAPGDVVWVPESEPIDWWELVKDVASFASTVATLYLIIDRQ